MERCSSQVHLFGDAQEAQEVRRQVDAAAADGVDVSMLEWLTREQIQQVCRLQLVHLSSD